MEIPRLTGGSATDMCLTDNKSTMKTIYEKPAVKVISIDPQLIMSTSDYGTTGADYVNGTGYDNDEEEG